MDAQPIPATTWKGTNNTTIYTFRYPANVSDVSASITGTVSVSNRLWDIRPFRLDPRNNTGVLAYDSWTQAIAYVKSDETGIHAKVGTNNIVFHEQVHNQSTDR